MENCRATSTVTDAAVMLKTENEGDTIEKRDITRESRDHSSSTRSDINGNSNENIDCTASPSASCSEGNTSHVRDTISKFELLSNSKSEEGKECKNQVISDSQTNGKFLEKGSNGNNLASDIDHPSRKIRVEGKYDREVIITKSSKRLDNFLSNFNWLSPVVVGASRKYFPSKEADQELKSESSSEIGDRSLHSQEELIGSSCEALKEESEGRSS